MTYLKYGMQWGSKEERKKEKRDKGVRCGCDEVVAREKWGRKKGKLIEEEET